MCLLLSSKRNSNVACPTYSCVRGECGPLREPFTPLLIYKEGSRVRDIKMNANIHCRKHDPLRDVSACLSRMERQVAVL